MKIVIGAFSHPIDVMNLEFEKRNIPDFIPRLLFGYMRLRFGIDFDKIAPVKNIRQSNMDIFLIHGDQDETIPSSMTLRPSCAMGKGRRSRGLAPLQVLACGLSLVRGIATATPIRDFGKKWGAFLQVTLSVPK